MATGTATLDFGANASAGTDSTTVDVTGQSGLSASSHLEAFFQSDSTALNDAEGHRFAATHIKCVCEYLTATSSRIYAYSRIGKVWGTFTSHWVTA